MHACPTGSIRRYADNHGAQLLEVTRDSVTTRFYAATDPNNAFASPIDCHRMTRDENGGVLHSNCDEGPPQRAYSLLTGAEASDNGNAGVMPWRCEPCMLLLGGVHEHSSSLCICCTAATTGSRAKT